MLNNWNGPGSKDWFLFYDEFIHRPIFIAAVREITSNDDRDLLYPVRGGGREGGEEGGREGS